MTRRLKQLALRITSLTIIHVATTSRRQSLVSPCTGIVQFNDTKGLTHRQVQAGEIWINGRRAGHERYSNINYSCI